ncbi:MULTISPECIES: YicC/YloC family endoribonuclease [Muribaculum]|jgi:TIGR00255 family protein|uniref:YicC/YloC family endoribonuclease n=3 Tax=Muribaculaceae TaxID=2005473 RepID=UPI000F47B5B4|nr:MULTISPECIES: YicC/YloC family endoribonuclease [Muribaculum]MCX4277673.1 YicC family protein [Muribaculum sp.]ROT13080.1 YicC family protein [Muribaculaceae bacterium Isolate-102 (HZI)]TGY05827.1 YicC family protein [Muribaculum sp. NM65_B17]THG43653.1 YicC family protein [Muribaculaceae bacterium]
MLLSMTGFGKSVVTIPNKKITVEIKSLNSKQLDISARVPAIFREKELELRNLIASVVERGKVDFQIYSESIGAETTVSLNIPLMAAYKAQVEEMARQLGIPWPDDWYGVLLRFPETVKSELPAALTDEESEALFNATREAIDGLMQFRAKEGKKLEEFFTKKISNIRELLSSVDPYEKERVVKIRARIEENLAKIDSVTFDKNRLEQEMIFYIEKLDINEEKQRLAQHLNYFMETMEHGNGQGKKLGFISQEMGREINTLGSKSNHAELQKIVVKMKDELEQIKEQVLNVM